MVKVLVWISQNNWHSVFLQRLYGKHLAEGSCGLDWRKGFHMKKKKFLFSLLAHCSQAFCELAPAFSATLLVQVYKQSVKRMMAITFAHPYLGPSSALIQTLIFMSTKSPTTVI